MFAEKFDALMNISEVSNSLLGRDVHINPSYIGRLRSGARPLPKKHEYLPAICRYLAGHINKEYQMNALQKLTGISSASLTSAESIVLYLEQWLSESEQDSSAAASRFVSGFSRPISKTAPLSADTTPSESVQKYAAYLYGNAGKRKAVEQFFTAILQEKKPQTLLLFSDENMDWLYEDTAFAARWAELFTKVIMKGNRVKIIHTVSRNMNEMLEAVTKWIPIYMTGMIEPYCYPRLRDGVFQRTLFIAPNTAAVVSSSVQQNTDGMLNLFLTDKAAVEALSAEYEHYFGLCRPLMRIYTDRNTEEFYKAAESLSAAVGAAYFCSKIPPLFALPEETVRTLSEQNGNNALFEQWQRSFGIFEKSIQTQRLTLAISNPRNTILSSDNLHPSSNSALFDCNLSYSAEYYKAHIEHLKKLERQYENLKVCFINDFAENTMLYVKEDTGVIMAKSSAPKTAFVISDRNMVNAFWDYTGKYILG